jgi:glycosyltransferase involved in cell wall biosynthesis
MRILVLCPFPEGVAAGQRLKYEQYLPDWRAAGFEVDVSSFMDRALYDIVYRPGHLVGKILGTLRGHLRRLRDLLRVPAYDLVYVFMYVTPFGTTIMERFVRRLARRLVYDLEDNILLGNDHMVDDHPNPILRLIRGGGKPRFLVRAADHVITSSPALNDLCLAINARRACTYISSSVDTDRFVPGNADSNDAKMVIGWTGTFSSRIYLDLLRPVFQELARRRPFRLRVIGNFGYALPGVDLEVLDWSVEREVEQLQGIDIGVYPLPVDAWVTGKSGLKAIQYMAFGLPSVATDVGTTPLIIRDGENGLLVRTEEEWVIALERLLDDPALRRRLGEQARRDAVAKYSVKAVAADYRRVLDSVMEPAR